MIKARTVTLWLLSLALFAVLSATKVESFDPDPEAISQVSKAIAEGKLMNPETNKTQDEPPVYVSSSLAKIAEGRNYEGTIIIGGLSAFTFPQSSTLSDRGTIKWSSPLSQPFDAKYKWEHGKYFDFNMSSAEDLWNLGKGGWDFERAFLSEKSVIRPTLNVIMAAEPNIAIFPKAYGYWGAAGKIDGIFASVATTGRMPLTYWISVGVSFYDYVRNPSIGGIYGTARNLMPMMTPQLYMLESVQHAYWDFTFKTMEQTSQIYRSAISQNKLSGGSFISIAGPNDIGRANFGLPNINSSMPQINIAPPQNYLGNLNLSQALKNYNINVDYPQFKVGTPQTYLGSLGSLNLSQTLKSYGINLNFPKTNWNWR